MIKRKYLILLALGGLIIALDQMTKMYIHTNFRLHESVVVIEQIFEITYVRNKGAAFGIFREAHETFRTIFFLTMPLLAVGIILVILRGLPEKENAQILALSAVAGGAIGNYIDRLRFGYVIDFLEVKYTDQYIWPAFNIADSAIVVGVCVLIFIMFKEGREEAKRKKQQKLAESTEE